MTCDIISIYQYISNLLYIKVISYAKSNQILSVAVVPRGNLWASTEASVFSDVAYQACHIWHMVSCCKLVTNNNPCCHLALAKHLFCIFLAIIDMAIEFISWLKCHSKLLLESYIATCSNYSFRTITVLLYTVVVDGQSGTVWHNFIFALCRCANK